MSKHYKRRTSRAKTISSSKSLELSEALDLENKSKQNAQDRLRYLSEGDQPGMTRRVTRSHLPESLKKVAILGPGSNLLYTLDQVSVFLALHP